jgi:peptidase M48-like protein
MIDRIVQRESEEVKILRQYDPVIEVYVQDMRSDPNLGVVPAADHYFLGKAVLSAGEVQLPSEGKKKVKPHAAKLGGLSGVFEKESIPDGFLQLIYLDSNGFDRQHYHLDYVRRELLGEVRCWVFDVTPVENTEGDRFLGRIWVEDQAYTIVRFNGAYFPGEHPKGFRLHFDSWRVSAAQGLWVPAYIYSAETEVHDTLPSHVRFQAQTRFWNYNPQRGGDKDRSVPETQPSQEREIEESVVDRLEVAGLLAPNGDVDKILSTVVNNLEVTNSLDIEPDVECRVLLTSTLESFTIGHTVLVSRGLLDVLPDEPSLAMVLAHEMGHILSKQSLGDQWALHDWRNFYYEDGFNHFGFPIDSHGEDAANAKDLQLLENSPYKDKLEGSVLFLRAIDSQANSLSNLISPHVRSRTPLAHQLSTASQDATKTKEGAIAALPMGSRIKLNPWNNQVETAKTNPVSSRLNRQPQPFEIRPSPPNLVFESDVRGAVQQRSSADDKGTEQR